jgi:S-adenosylmethionine:tRNA ribosyltransferase-isomerase
VFIGEPRSVGTREANAKPQAMFDFDLPPDLVAQEPCSPRDQSRLLVVRRQDRSLAHHRFADLPSLLTPGDLLVLNDTRVLAARLLGRRRRTGGKWEGLFLRVLPEGLWEMLCQSRGKLQEGEIIAVEPEPLELQIEKRLGPGRWSVRPLHEGTAEELLATCGHVPLPPYIRKGADRPEDRERYQTVFARRPGAVAAPTAGLHFTSELLGKLRERGVLTTQITLHVGLGTFQPLQSDDLTKHVMHREMGELPEAAAEAIRACKERGKRVIAVGTTSVRVLETVAATGPLRSWSGQTDLFIHAP